MKYLTFQFYLFLRKLSVCCLLSGLCCLAFHASRAVAADSGQPTLMSGQAGNVYRLAPFDKVKVSVYGEEDLSSEQLISDNGEVHLPLIGAINIGEHTIAQAAKMIEQAFVQQEYLRKPVVTISIEEFSSKTVTVMGEVGRPGTVTLTPGQNGLPIQIAIAEAGGFKNTAKTGEVMVTRAKVPQGEAITLVVDVDDLLSSRRKEDAPTSILIRPGDVVFVPRRVF
jgi:polysaccharide export outer membrane protein